MIRHKVIYSLLVVAISGSVMVSCQKNMIEKEPLENADEELVFDRLDSMGVYAEQFLYNTYNQLPKGYNRVSGNILDAGTDDAVPNGANDQVQYFSTSQWNTFNLPDNVWNDYYAGIRKVNLFLSKIDRVPLRIPGLMDQWKAEARVLRAMFYFELTKRWGGVPLIGDKVFDKDEKISLSQASYDDCVDYITKELDAAAPALPPAYATAYFGRITRGAAMAIKARILLYAASPLNNPQDTRAKWDTAAKAALAVMNTKTYTLTAAFNDVFIVRKNTETILAYMAAPNSTVEANNGPVGTPRGDKGKTNPTQELVDEFETLTGKMISETGSGYDPNNPYTNRDPRLAATVFYNGMSWLGRTVQTYDGGIDRPAGYGNTNAGETRTGYYMRKFLGTGGGSSSYANAEHCFPIIRYAEILLDYAEAKNEADGAVAEVYAAVELVRQRAKLNPFKLPVGLTKEQMRARIRHERRVELAFEEHRHWDIRRWKIAENVLNGSLHGIQIKLNGAALSYTVVPVQTVTFDKSKMYLYPFPYSEVITNKGIVQNANWE
ncbi:RagB/SusD family nutrient uptake outer membrane protein [uncultured Chitinophaga sp.]|uniref:RagB/SusD family nutrient uptake outer membrane protein n=1 Tax=uncultured Chitinophaga sp. TaxID=339340 RepID=UPI0025F669E3|nr:RagB/SusD family nutrient uptake outer membrane protein [uncultured Chitinophaga sp.]